MCHSEFQECSTANCPNPVRMLDAIIYRDDEPFCQMDLVPLPLKTSAAKPFCENCKIAAQKERQQAAEQKKALAQRAK